jgi:hypothetical protein
MSTAAIEESANAEENKRMIWVIMTIGKVMRARGIGRLLEILTRGKR